MSTDTVELYVLSSLCKVEELEENLVNYTNEGDEVDIDA